MCYGWPERPAERSTCLYSPLLSLQWAVRDSAGSARRSEARTWPEQWPHGVVRTEGRRSAVIVDDIVTTGTTVREAARALTEAGWHVSGAAVVRSDATR